MKARFYAKRKGVELKDHRLTGAEWGGTGAYIGYVGNYPVRDMVYVSEKRGEPSVPVHAADVQDAPVMLKEWWAPETNWPTKEYVFATKQQIEAAGKKLVEIPAVTPDRMARLRTTAAGFRNRDAFIAYMASLAAAAPEKPATPDERKAMISIAVDEATWFWDFGRNSSAAG